MASSKSPCPTCVALPPVALPCPAVLPRLLPLLLPALTAAVPGAACSFLGTSGQPVADLLRYSGLEDPLAVMESTLRWRHLAPTAPDTLGEPHRRLPDPCKAPFCDGCLGGAPEIGRPSENAPLPAPLTPPPPVSCFGRARLAPWILCVPAV
jgi:hypothetical protein